MPASLARLAALALALVAVGCGGEDEGPGTPPAGDETEAASPADDETVVVAALGDSITAGSPGFDPDPQQRELLGFGNDEESQFEFWATDAEPSLEFRNCGVFGERTDEIAMRLDECAEGADVLIVQGGINDIAQGLAGGPDGAEEAASLAVGNIDSMIKRGLDQDLEVLVTNVLPWNNGHPIADSAITEANTGIEQVADRRGVTLLEFHDALLDPGQAGVMALPLTADGDHPSVEGYRILGELVAGELG